MKILVAEKFEKSGLDALASMGCKVTYLPETPPDQLGAALTAAGASVLVVRGKKVLRSAIEAGAGSNLRMIVRAGAGYDSIDLTSATERGVAVCNCPGMNAAAVAELALGLLICCDRRIPEQVIEVRAGTWNKKEYSRARGLRGMTLGVLGVGAIGRHMITFAKALGMKCIAHSLSMTRERAADLGVEYGGTTRADLHAMAARCDAVSIHVSANAESEKMCDAAFFEALKAGAYFINTSRGSVVDEAALRQAIATKGVRAGLDVFSGEPGEPATEWKSQTAALAGVYGTHHVGASTDQAQNAVADEVVRVVRVFKESGRCENQVNATPVRVVGGPGAPARC